jgi:cellulose synthase (UDP-forming)
VSAARFRGVALLVAAATAFWLPWAILHVNGGALWLGIPFLAANLLLAVSLLVTLVNNWQRSAAPDRIVMAGTEPDVAVIVPTAGEPAEQLRRTVLSVLRQDWPRERLALVVSDDAWSDEIRELVAEIAAAFPDARVDYHRPPRKDSAEREGDAKAGNLNSALRRVDEIAPGAYFVETRDADDLVGDATFLRRCVAQLRANPDVAYVQTVKEAHVSRGDPFDNLQPHFFRGAMFARNAANAVFPCGSGLVWRREALEDIGRFPTWNVVEDLQSGVEALRRGWRGLYVPIRGAIGQHAPEDLPNVYKQRGTWTVDTMRLLVWGDLSGLSLRQRLHFLDLGLFYLQSFSTLLFIACPVISFLAGVYPLQTQSSGYLLHFVPFAVAVEVYFAALTAGVPYERIWKARQIWVGLSPVYAKACVLAILGGPNRKPVYRVTRKHHEHRWYWREVLPQMALLALLLVAIAKALTTESLLDGVDLGSLYWATMFVLVLGCFIPKSWHGVSPRARRARRSRRVERPIPRATRGVS